jgi:hypothetical protein
MRELLLILILFGLDLWLGVNAHPKVSVTSHLDTVFFRFFGSKQMLRWLPTSVFLLLFTFSSLAVKATYLSFQVMQFTTN